MVVSGQPSQLDYAPPPPHARRARVLRWAVVGSVLLSLYLCRMWPLQMWQHGRLLYLQRQCLKHPIVAGTIVYSSGTPELAIASPAWNAFATADPTYYTIGATPNGAATVFLGERQASNGTRRLIEVEAHPHWKPKRFSDVMMFTRSVDLSLTRPLQENFQPGGGATCNAGPSWPGTVPDIVVYSATADSIDLSHITFQCRLFEQDYIVDGYLQNDGRFVLTKWTDRTPTPGTGN
jgi:hypothetical protein